MISIAGEIQPGDLDGLLAHIRNLQTDSSVVGLFLNSPGGSLLEAEQLAAYISRKHLPVLVVSNNVCASACFLVFAASKFKFVSPDAFIGVHSASEVGGEESLMSMGATTAFARDLSEYDVPEEVIGKLVETKASKVSWLTGAELAAMGVRFLPTNSQLLTPKSSVTEPETSGVSGETAKLESGSREPSSTDIGSEAYNDGLRDRGTWEAWFNAQSGSFRAGAAFWAGERSLRRPRSCQNPGFPVDTDWSAGCVKAYDILTPSDVRRRSDARYRLGWNSYSAAAR